MNDNEMMKLRSTKFSSSSWVHSFLFSSLSELEWFERCFPLHPSCHHLKNEHVQVESMNMLKVKGTNMVEEHGYPMNHRLGRRV
jgi:hypothetical protein